MTFAWRIVFNFRDLGRFEPMWLSGTPSKYLKSFKDLNLDLAAFLLNWRKPILYKKDTVRIFFPNNHLPSCAHLIDIFNHKIRKSWNGWFFKELFCVDHRNQNNQNEKIFNHFRKFALLVFELTLNFSFWIEMWAKL